MAFVTQTQWHLDKEPNKDALDGYDLTVHGQQVEIDAETHNTAWEQLVLTRYQHTANPMDLIPTIKAIQDGRGRALAMQMLLSLLRTREMPLHPLHPSDTINSQIVPAPASADLSGAIPVPKLPPASTPLSAKEPQTKEREWRAQIEAIRAPLVATCDHLTSLTSTLDASPLTASVHLSLAENYVSLLEEQKGSIAFEQAAVSLNRAYQNEHGWMVVAWQWFRDTIPPALLALLVYGLALYHDLFKKLTEHYTSLTVLKRWPDKEFAAAVGKALPTNPIVVPNGLTDTARR